MTADQMIQSVKSETKPDFSNDTEKCLWLAGAGRWEAAHRIVESLPEPAAAWIHALLHRDEGDLSNASYWYIQARRPMPKNSISISDEWESIVRELL